ncbi:hypothetical protein I5Q34_30275 [Streptomyces sp. AV19]|uniref:DUF6624 domain-containing protein n=1 Tax=Streptomyces sp. AV19 TaxID=2793068 RepID=UPI0018FEDED8|nr:DUF6624 domain-containing protein [Streptomyces sp. AV19]MBH1938495.1 hypothetical protein [Streptomyces sp. AV19]MDG4535144.1 hypothetical protein [Streptomyces sp. AV19]
MTDDEARLAGELVAMAAEDHAATALAHSEDVAERLAWRRLTARHGDRLDEIMDGHGWPTADRFGADAARAAWLIAQHADHQLHVQRRAVELMTAAVESGAASVRDLAFLTDRTLTNEGREQIYGTQIAGVDADGGPVPWPCREPDRVDALRAGVGIEPFAAYTARHAPR